MHHLLLSSCHNYVKQEECLATAAKDSNMQQLVPLIIVLVIFVGAFGYMTYRNAAERRAREKKRNQYHDRV
jgi:hypothetical protein